MRTFAYLLFYGFALWLCVMFLPDVWREAHGFWNTVISISVVLFVLGMALGVALWAIDIGLAAGDRLHRFTQPRDEFTPEPPRRSVRRPFRTSPGTRRWIGRRSR
ncbi:MAG: hypothetical protein VB131_01465 [Burkholderia gladioli]